MSATRVKADLAGTLERGDCAQLFYTSARQAIGL